jgi:hypothetical protein
MGLFPIDLFSQRVEYPVNPYFLPLVFDGKFTDSITTVSLPSPCLKMALDSTARLNDCEGNNRGLPVLVKRPDDYINRLREKAYRDFLRNCAPLVKYSRLHFPTKVEKVEPISPNIFQSLFTVEAGYERKVDRSTRFVPKRKYWIYGGSSLLQFSQNYISDNWYNGGIGNQNLLSVQNFTFNYKKGKIQSNHTIEWKLSFYTNSNDSLRDFRLGEDLVRTYSDFGLKAFNDKWSYSTNLEIKTKLFRNYKENSQEYISALFSPLQINMGILGMKYQLEKKFRQDKYKKYNFSVDISPLSVQYTWVADRKVDPVRYGIQGDNSCLLDLGSTLNAKIVIHFNRQVSFTSRFKYFTNYEKVIFESENELNIPLNRFFSTRLYLYGRFDDSSGVKRDPFWGHLQLNELLSFGFNFKW